MFILMYLINLALKFGRLSVQDEQIGSSVLDQLTDVEIICYAIEIFGYTKDGFNSITFENLAKLFPRDEGFAEALSDARKFDVIQFSEDANIENVSIFW